MDVFAGNTYYYWLEAVDYVHSTMFGPQYVDVPAETIPEIPLLNIIRPAYPNPVRQNSTFTLEISLKQGVFANVLILNRQYAVMKEFSVSEGIHKLFVSTSSFAPGLYRVYMHTSDGQYAYGDVLVVNEAKH